MDLDRLEAAIGLAEDFRARAYKDSTGKWSIGEGICLETAPLTAEEWKALLDAGLIDVTITPAGAHLVGRGRLQGIGRQLAAAHPKFWGWLNDAQQNAICEMAYQLGVGGEGAFHDFNSALDRHDLAAAYAAGKDSNWYRTYTTRADRVLTQLRTGQWPISPVD